MKTFFIGAFNDINAQLFLGSVAGAKVQSEIIDALSCDESEVEAFIMPEVPSWPKGDLYVRASRNESCLFLPLLNIVFFKIPFFFLQVMFLFFWKRPGRIIFYNSSISGCLCSLLLKIFQCQTILILQDVKLPVFFKWSVFFRPKRFLNLIYAKLLSRSYNYYVPITEDCVVDLGLPSERSVVFPGAVLTSKILRRNIFSDCELRDYGVFAGALEYYNGIDLLVENWPLPNSSKYKLHVFGSGSLANFVVKCAGYNGNIIFHGFKSPSVVDNYLSHSRFNFCLRYSKGIDQSYFYPSKFFELLLLPGALVCNYFSNIPVKLRGFIEFVDDDLSNLLDMMENGQCLVCKDHDVLLDVILKDHTWAGFLSRYMEDLNKVF